MHSVAMASERFYWQCSRVWLSRGLTTYRMLSGEREGRHFSIILSVASVAPSEQVDASSLLTLNPSYPQLSIENASHT